MQKQEILRLFLDELHDMRNCRPSVLLPEVVNNQNALYYDTTLDETWKKQYYSCVDIDRLPPKEVMRQLSHLVRDTHTCQNVYSVSKSQFLYTWVDLHQDGKLRGIYSGKAMHPAQAMVEDEETIEKRFQHYQHVIEHPDTEKQKEKKLIHLSRRFRFNTEHVVPQSWFQAEEPMKGDLHHLFACQPECNKMRSNYPYFDPAQPGQGMENHCGTLDVEQFSPQQGKGPAARATLYFLLRYPHHIGSKFREKIDLPTLAKWHAQFPVTRYEKHRNKAIFEIQGNRNPFIDYPNDLQPLIPLLSFC